jgi:hypothetical protein
MLEKLLQTREVLGAILKSDIDGPDFLSLPVLPVT